MSFLETDSAGSFADFLDTAWLNLFASVNMRLSGNAVGGAAPVEKSDGSIWPKTPGRRWRYSTGKTGCWIGCVHASKKTPESVEMISSNGGMKTDGMRWRNSTGRTGSSGCLNHA